MLKRPEQPRGNTGTPEGGTQGNREQGEPLINITGQRIRPPPVYETSVAKHRRYQIGRRPFQEVPGGLHEVGLSTTECLPPEPSRGISSSEKDFSNPMAVEAMQTASATAGQTEMVSETAHERHGPETTNWVRRGVSEGTPAAEQGGTQPTG